MKLELFNYNLPKKLIANKPAQPRDHSKLLVFDRKNNAIKHDKYLNLDKYLTQNDVLVFNNSKVFPARLFGQKESGGKVEVLLLKKLDYEYDWEVMLRSKRAKIGLKLLFKQGLSAILVKRLSEKTWLLKFNKKGSQFNTIINKIGQIPIPPYIESKAKQSELKKQYQTVYAKQIGSAAAPTAGLHFTNRLLKKIKDKGCKIEYITLHVGLGTFEPVTTENIEDYKIHKEWVTVDKKTINNLTKYKKQGKRIITVGTTSVRTLEAIMSKKQTTDFNDYVDIYIYPGYKFKFIDAMITNFHLPKSSLLMLVSAFIGRQQTLKLYKIAIKLRYRFFSFGDGMFIY